MSTLPPLPHAGRPQAITYRRLTTRYRKSEFPRWSPVVFLQNKYIPKTYPPNTQETKTCHATYKCRHILLYSYHKNTNTIYSTQTTLCAKLLLSSPLRRSRRLEMYQKYITPNTQETSHLVPQRISYVTHSIKLC